MKFPKIRFRRKNFRYLKVIYNGRKDKKIQFENNPSQLRNKYAEVVSKIFLLFTNGIFLFAKKDLTIKIES